MLSPFNLGIYADFSRVVNDQHHAKEMKLIVKSIKSRTVKKLEQNLRDIPSEDPDWRNKVMSLKSQIATERCKKHNNLSIIKYDKQQVNADNTHTLGLFRSVITNGSKILSFAPPKSIKYENFKEKIGKCKFQEYVEGTMVNMFYDNENEEWEIATRSNIGARCKFYQDITNTFRTMFLETMNNLKYEFSMFNTEYSYSWVLQHPDNRIVAPFVKSSLILTNIYDCNYGGKPGVIMEIPINPLNESQYWNPGDPDIHLFTPKSLEKLIDCTGMNINELMNIFEQNSIDYSIMGAVIYDEESGTRMKIRNPSYEHVRRLKGNSPKLQFQYYKLRQSGLVGEFLKFYPENKVQFSKFRQQVHDWTNSLYRNYIRCYIKKEAPLKEFKYEYRTHMFRLHRHYLDELKPSSKFVNKTETIEFVNNMPCEHLMCSINYPLRKPKVDHIKNIVSQN
jgi:hypothetical protein